MGLNKRLIGAGATASGGLTPSENFKVVTYTGTGSAQSITGVGFQPDLVWIKHRDGTGSHSWTDSTRGNNLVLQSNETSAEASGQITLDSDGFTIGNGNALRNSNGASYVAWCWKANGGTTSTGSGTNTTSVTNQVNSDAGFSITTFTGSASAAGNFTHGLGEVPDMYIVKSRSFSDSWFVWHKDLTNTTGYALRLNTTAAEQNLTGFWNDTAPTSTLISLGNGVLVNNATYVAYAFKSIEGFSSFGSYTGNGSANGPIVETGFEPAFVMIKRTDAAGTNWNIMDSERGNSDYLLAANTSDSEVTNETPLNIASNGFEITEASGYINASGGTYIYMAFAADPDTEAPTLADSFNIATYTGTGATRSITGLGFQPNLVWIKDRSATRDHNLTDSVRGVTHPIYIETGAQLTNSTFLTSFDTDGFSLGNQATSNQNGDDFVAWAWKADDNEPTIIPAAGPDSVDNEYPVVAYHNITYTSSGKFNGGYVFNGGGSGTTGSAIFVPQFERNTSIDFTSSGVSASGWFYSTGSPSGNASHVLFSMYGDCGFNIQYTSNRTIIYSGAINGNTNKTMPSNAWTHIAFTYSSSGYLKVYVNGSASSSYNVGTSALQAGSPRVNGIGAVADNGDHTGPTSWFYAFQGTISQARYFNSELTQANVNTLYGESASDNETLDILGDGKCIAAYTLSKELSEVAIVSANANAGFSIVNWEQIPATGTTVPHGLSAAPNMIITKATNDTDNWYVYHSAMGTGKFMYLNLGNAQVSNAGGYSAVGASTFTSNLSNNSGIRMISYCFHDIAGYQKFGSYAGNGTSQSINVGFQPDFVMLRKYDSSQDWMIFDSVRDGNPKRKRLEANNSDAEVDETTNINFTSTGFEFTSGYYNDSGYNSIYWAIKMNPTPMPLAGNMSFLVVAGGASGGRTNAGGGGAGGLRTSYGGSSGGGSSAESDITLAAGTYTITVGAGGAALTSNGVGNNGVDSSIAASGLTTITSVGGGGGYGFTYSSNNANSGGSGGGAGTTGSNSASGFGSGTANQGFDGGARNATANTYAGGGGGGASAAGQTSPGQETGGAGGAGLAVLITGSSVTYAGGGGGGGGYNGGAAGAGGSGGGTAGGYINDAVSDATANTGGGSGGTRNAVTAGSGGSGVVILRLLTSEYSSSVTGSPTVTTDGDYTVLKYTGSGTYVHS